MKPSLSPAEKVTLAADLAQAVLDIESSPGLGHTKEMSLHLLYLYAYSLSASHLAAVKRTATNPAEHPYIRGAAFVILGRSDTRSSINVKRFEQAISIFESMSPYELDEKIWSLYQPGVPSIFMTIRETLSLPYCWFAFAKKRNRRSTDFSLDEMQAGFREMLPVNRDRPISSEALMRVVNACAARIYGTICECCRDASTNSLTKKCAGCKSVYYCSHECQSRDWKQGHKLICRPPEELIMGDLVMLERLLSGNLNGVYRQVERYDEIKGRWIVTWVHGSHPMLIKPENLKRLLTGEELTEILEVDK
ncbi:hypothetical protein HDU98_010228 [Podochytrium sp. JEL0797]|nr:hypothetical protein HDU98_010228 [Podochytrium sp. JEL0797]